MGKRILIVGGNGYVGSSLAKALAPLHEVHCTYRKALTPIDGVTYHCFDQIADKDYCRALADKMNPQVIIYCAGKNDPDLYEEDQNLAQLIFSGGPGAMLSATEIMKPKFILISSDYVFAGNDGNYGESDNPLSFTQFGKAKIGGENATKTRSMNYTILRAAPLMGRGTMDHPSWLDAMRTKLILGKPISVPAKVFHNPVSISLLIQAAQKVIELDIRNKIIHVGGLSKVSPYEFAILFAQKFGFNEAQITASDIETHSIYDYSLNFSDTIKLFEAESLLLEQSFDLLE